jgi:hypothetical protein
MTLGDQHRVTALTRLILVLCITLATALPARAAMDEVPETRRTLPADVIGGLGSLLATVGKDPAQTFSPTAAGAVIDFVADTPSDTVLYHAGNAFPEASAYHRFDAVQDMATFLKLAFNPEIPSYALMPSSVRFSKWQDVEGNDTPLPILWTELDTLSEPRVIRGIETMENTPDTFSGAYYAYDLYRTMILMRHRGQPVLISLSKQADISDTGKKGLVLGTDENWAYLYSGQNGLSKPGMGWVDSYMYDSYSVSVYIEPENAPGTVHCGVFKWVRAGWSSINMVRAGHIYTGLVRYGNSFTEVINSPRLPDWRQMGMVFSAIDRVDGQTLRDTFSAYLNTVEKRFGDDASFPRRWFTDWFKSAAYLTRVTEEQMRAAMVVEYVRQVLGKPPCMDLSALLGMRRRLAG